MEDNYDQGRKTDQKNARKQPEYLAVAGGGTGN
jgi:hypothetical protein